MVVLGLCATAHKLIHHLRAGKLTFACIEGIYMRTPAGKECRFYYQNFHRQNNIQECRLIDNNPHSEPWEVRDCSTCPVPDILQANSSPDLVLEGSVRKKLFGFGRHIDVKAFCSKHLIDVPQPQVGCLVCAKERPGLMDLFGQ